MVFTNGQIAKKLREVAAAYTIKRGNLFQIRAYENAAATVEHATSELHDLWEEERLEQIPGIGKSLRSHLEELFTTGKVKHWEEIKKSIPQGFFEVLGLSGIGPKIAWELSKLGVKDREDLREKLESGSLVKAGFSEKLALKILISLKNNSKAKSDRMLLPYAFTQAQKVLDYLKKSPEVEQAEVLGSLRRMVATVGDLDFAVASNNPQKISNYISEMPGAAQVLDQGERKVSLLTNFGLRLDFLIADPQSFGALLQHFTGSKAHNIHLRTLAEHKGFSLSEYGIRKVKTRNSKVKSEGQNSKVIPTKTEKEFYQLLGMDIPPPEIREDNGEIEAALKHQLPKLVEIKDINGDLHLHDSFDIEPSHDLGENDLSEIVQKGKSLGYKYIGISDHSPSLKKHSPRQIVDLIKKHKKLIEQQNYSYKSIRVLNLLEVDILLDGTLSVPEEGLKELDFVIASVHSVHDMPKVRMTKRLLKALENPYVKVLGHPTNRLIEKRPESDIDWEVIFKLAASKGVALEINASPDRLDLPDQLVRMAKSLGVKFVINTDAHEVAGMENMFFGVAVARRAWLTKEDVINSWEWTRFARWSKI
ncbi:MAG: DNA polymerase/3'-5' exonuclease PolX [bacterium]|nr:DNA polymerase/3'-5' exonuclease PolX [bacterium]